ncbi:MAG: MATE family efflux transporter [Pseudomonadota bacterium]
MTETSIFKQDVSKVVFSFGWPAALNCLMVTIYNITDAAFVGLWVGGNSIAVVTVVGIVVILLNAFGIGIGVGGSAIINRMLGSGRSLEIATVFACQNALSIILLLLSLACYLIRLY